jgi:hypothetical protein
MGENSSFLLQPNPPMQNKYLITIGNDFLSYNLVEDYVSSFLQNEAIK